MSENVYLMRRLAESLEAAKAARILREETTSE